MPTDDAKRELVIYQRGTPPEHAVRLWPDQTALGPGVIQEAREYLIELRMVEQPDQVTLFIDDWPVEALRSPSSSTARWRWSPGFYAGRIEIGIDFGDGIRHDTSVVIDPDLDKLTRDDFDTMVREILEDTFALFALSGFRTGIERGTGNHVPPIAQIEFLRSRVAELEKIVRDISDHPVRVLQPEEETRGASGSARLTSGELERSFRSGPLDRLPPSTPLPSSFRGVFPRQVRRVRKTPLLDIGEHRAIKGALLSWRSLLSSLAARLQSDRAEEREAIRRRDLWASRCRLLAGRIDLMLDADLFDEVGEPAYPLVATSVFRNVVAYNRFYRLYRDMSLGLSAVQGKFLQMPLARTFDLYELWSFIRLIRAIAERYQLANFNPRTLFDEDMGNRGIALVRSSVLVPLGPTTTIAFKRSFKEYWTTANRCGSYSREMEPDVSFSNGQSAPNRNVEKLIVLDAKYRIEEQLNEAVGSLHMYRDSIVQDEAEPPVRRAIVGAYLLTPHVPALPTGSWMKTKMPGRLFHPDYRAAFNFGALTLRPGMPLPAIADAFDSALRDAGITEQEVRGQD